jgi:DNA repair exonuclease SbcCD nuclease subunit
MTLREDTHMGANDSTLRRRILVVGDNHLTDAPPVMRSDNYGEACLAELRETLQIASEKRVELALFLGDIFDKLRVGKEYLDCVLRAFAADEKGRPWPFRKAVVVGNHDIKHNMQLYPQSALCTLVSAGVLELSDHLEEFGIGCAHFHANLDAEIADGLFVNDPRKPLIWAAHANITTQQIFGNFILFKDLQVNPECRLVVAGHVHIPMEQKLGGVQFINPGNVGRKDATKENLGRDVRVLVVDYALDGSDLSFEYVKLESALPSDQVFKVAEIQEKKDIKKDTDEFMKRANQLSIFASDDGDRPKEILQSAKLKGIPQKVAQCAADAVEKVIEEKGKR